METAFDDTWSNIWKALIGILMVAFVLWGTSK